MRASNGVVLRSIVNSQTETMAALVRVVGNGGVANRVSASAVLKSVKARRRIDYKPSYGMAWRVIMKVFIAGV